MEFTFARQIQGLNPSAIREILKYAADPEVVSLSAGNLVRVRLINPLRVFQFHLL